MKDNFNREITYARLSVTDLCNMRCKYCMPTGVEKKSHADILSIEEFMLISDVLAELGVTKQRLTGGEPLVRRGILSLIEHIGQNGNVEKLGMTTNGQLLYDMADELKEKGINLLNISIDTLDEVDFSVVTGGGSVRKTIQGIEKAVDIGFQKIKLNSVLLRGINDDKIKDLAKFAKAYDLEIRFIELMPFANTKCFQKEYFISQDDIIKSYNLQNIESDDKFDKVRRYRFPNGLEVGFISPVTNKFCDGCNRIRITADGKLLNCLHGNVEFDLKPYLNDRDLLKEYIVKCVKEKPKCHNLDDGVLQTRIMEHIGG